MTSNEFIIFCVNQGLFVKINDFDLVRKVGSLQDMSDPNEFKKVELPVFSDKDFNSFVLGTERKLQKYKLSDFGKLIDAAIRLEETPLHWFRSNKVSEELFFDEFRHQMGNKHRRSARINGEIRNQDSSEKKLLLKETETCWLRWRIKKVEVV